MMIARARNLVVGLVGLAVTTGWMGAAAAQSIYVPYYTPQFYVDHLVFYDENGTPIYYEDDLAYSVPPDYPEYNDLVNAFQANMDGYYRWFEEVGYANLAYRRPAFSDYYKPRYYQDYLVFYDAAGRPFYYVDGQQIFVPSTDPAFIRLTRHYQKKNHLYRRWYREYGRHYRWYRRPIYTDYYRPLYYKGFLVYYDDTGLPYYYEGNRIVHVPRSYRNYNRYTDYYRQHRPQYQRWYRDVGNKHHGYRQSKLYRRRIRNEAAPRATRGRAVERRYQHRLHGDHKPHLAPVPQRPAVRPAPGHRDHDLQPNRPGRPMHETRPQPAMHPNRPGRPMEEARPRPAPQPRPAIQPNRPGRPMEQARPRPAPQPRPAIQPNRPGRPMEVKPRPAPQPRPAMQPRPGAQPKPPRNAPGRVDCRKNPGHPDCGKHGGSGAQKKRQHGRH